eukprot:97253_1
MACVAVVFAIVANLCVYAFGEVTNGSVTAFLLEKYKDDKSIIVFLMMANTVVSLSVLFTYPLQLFPTFELIGPKAAAFWWKLRHGGKRGAYDDEDYDEHDLEGFGPMPTLHEHEEASHSSFHNEQIYDNFEKVVQDSSPGSNGPDNEVVDFTR